MGAYYGYRMAGVYQFDDFTWQNDSDPSVPLQDRVYTLKEGRPVPSEGSPRPGDLKFADLSAPTANPTARSTSTTTGPSSATRSPTFRCR